MGTTASQLHYREALAGSAAAAAGASFKGFTTPPRLLPLKYSQEGDWVWHQSQRRTPPPTVRTGGREGAMEAKEGVRERPESVLLFDYIYLQLRWT